MLADGGKSGNRYASRNKAKGKSTRVSDEAISSKEHVSKRHSCKVSQCWLEASNRNASPACKDPYVEQPRKYASKKTRGGSKRPFSKNSRAFCPFGFRKRTLGVAVVIFRSQLRGQLAPQVAAEKAAGTRSRLRGQPAPQVAAEMAAGTGSRLRGQPAPQVATKWVVGTPRLSG